MDQAALSASIEAFALDAGAPSDRFALLRRLVEAVRQQLGNIPESAKAMLRDAALQAYDRIAAAYDIPGIGEPFESMAEKLLRDVLENLLNGLLQLG